MSTFNFITKHTGLAVTSHQLQDYIDDVVKTFPFKGVLKVDKAPEHFKSIYQAEHEAINLLSQGNSDYDLNAVRTAFNIQLNNAFIDALIEKGTVEPQIYRVTDTLYFAKLDPKTGLHEYPTTDTTNYKMRGKVLFHSGVEYTVNSGYITFYFL